MLRRRAPEEPRVLSFAQEGLWYLSQLAPQSAAYNVAYQSRLRGRLDKARLERATHAVVERHEPLRTIFVASGGRPVPFPLKKSRAALATTDLRGFPSDARPAEAARLIRLDASRPFDLSRDSMFRPALFQLDDDDHILLHTAPHIVFEGNSLNVLYRDLAGFYNGSDLPQLTNDYGDFALWQRQHLRGARLAELSAYWRQQLAALPQADLPADFPRPAIHTGRGKRHYFDVPPDLLESANRFFRDARTTGFRGLLAVFLVFVYSECGLTDICVGSPFAPLNPNSRGLADLIGYFVNTVPLRTTFAASQTFRDLLRLLDQVLWDAVLNSDLSFGQVVEAVQPPRDPSRTVLAQLNFRAPRHPLPALQLNGIDASIAKYVDTGSSKFDLALEVESSCGKASYFEYCTDLFQETTILRMKEKYLSLLRSLIDAPDRPIGEIIAGLPRAHAGLPQTHA